MLTSTHTARLTTVMGLGSLGDDAEIATAAQAFVAQHGLSPSIDLVKGFLSQYDKPDQQVAGNAFIDLGVPAAIVDPALGGGPPVPANTWKYVIAAVSTISGGTAAYHGYKRNQSVGWAVLWFICGAALPVVTQAVAIAQGYGKPIE